MGIASVGSPAMGSADWSRQAQIGAEQAQAEEKDVQAAVSVEMLKKAIDIKEDTMQSLMGQMGDVIPPSSAGLVNLSV